MSTAIHTTSTDLRYSRASEAWPRSAIHTTPVIESNSVRERHMRGISGIGYMCLHMFGYMCLHTYKLVLWEPLQVPTHPSR